VKTGRLAVISLLTDFGTADYFVGAVKAAILSVNPHAAIADITHEIAPQDIPAGAFTLLAAYKTFPKGTVHFAVVDPGVGSTRRPIIVSANGQYFVGPDNGLFTYIYDREAGHKVFHVTAEKYFRTEASVTFHGRDIFAPVAGALSNGVKPRQFGPRIKDAVRLPVSLEPEVLENGDVRARIIHIDRFGNCVTNITRKLVKPNATLLINRKTIRDFRNFYGEASTRTPFAIWGSAGFLEISVNGASAAKILKVQRDDRVVLTLRRNDVT
jgi:S-adenosylmethionine hydrolase